MEAEVKKGVAFVISGPSGAGKSTLFQELTKGGAQLRFSVSCTTRPPRPGETDGKDYYFISRTEFEQRITNGDFIEYAEVFDNLYGTLRSEVTEHVCAGQNVFLDIDVQGARQIRQRAETDPELAAVLEFIFVAPPGLDVLEKRLRERNTESDDQLALRLGQAKNEMTAWREYDYLVVNDQLDRAAAELAAIIKTAELKTSRRGEEWCQ